MLVMDLCSQNEYCGSVACVVWIRCSEVLIMIGQLLALVTGSWDVMGNCSLTAYHRSTGDKN